ncbi:Sm-like ribonucleoprotein [Biscogniauxia marginata]|nr:Sm-like ribonucleoprotein [Biscogniauxia marginata]
MSLHSYVNKQVLIITADSRTLVLGQTVERVIRTPDDHEPSTEVPLGLYLVRGDNVCVVGLVDEALDDSINWQEVKGSAIGGIKHI